jgi:hypothetical protein
MSSPSHANQVQLNGALLCLSEVSLSSYLCSCWQTVDRLLDLLQEAPIQNHELAYLSSIEEINPELSYPKRLDAPAYHPEYLAKVIVCKLIDYRKQNYAYYQSPSLDVAASSNANRSSFWLGWGI